MARDATNPDYYKHGNLQCIEVVGCFANTQDLCVGSIIQYLWRWRGKNGLEDLQKARWYLDKLIADVEAGNVPVQE